MDSMSFRNNRSTTPQRTSSERAGPLETTQPDIPPAPRAHRKEVPPKKSRKLLGIVVGIVVLLALFSLAWWLVAKPGTVSSTIDGNKFQAVFFTNGQVYFGKLGIVNGEYMRLTDIYYLQTKAADTKDDKNPQETATDSNDVELIKLGSEIHGPDDEMIISKDQVLFFENLKDDSTVSKTISQYQDKQE